MSNLNKKGFTLVEIISVIVIIGIILAIAIPGVISVSKNSKVQMYDSKVGIIEKAAELYGNDNLDENDYEAKIVTIEELLNRNYLKKDENDCTIGTDCIKNPETDTGMDKENVCLCTIDNRVVAEYIGSNNSCDGTMCDPNNLKIQEDEKIPQFELNFNVDGGSSCNPESITKNKDDEWGTLCTTSRKGYSFEGWYTDVNNPYTMIESSSKAESNITVYAKWKLNSYKLTINPNGGSYSGSTGYKEITQDAFSTYSLSNPTRTNYYFNGWSKSGTCELSGNTFTFDGNCTLTANWRIIQYTLTYDSQGGSYCSSKTANVGSAWGTLCSPSKTNYRFDGWFTGTNGTGTQITSSSTVSGNQTVYASWTYVPPTYTLTYDSQGGSYCSSKTATEGYSWGTLCEPSKSGYSFGGWYTSTNGYGSRIYSSTTAYNNQTVYAYWIYVPPTYTLTYDSQGGSYCSSKTATSGNSWGTLCEPSKSGYSFGGWYTSTNGYGSRIYSSTTAYSNQTVYAYWIYNAPTTYTLTLDKSDGSSIQYITQNANTTYTPYSLSDYEMEMGDMNGTTTYEYIFNGWTHSGGGSWNGSTFTFTGDGKLKANWTVREKVSAQSCTYLHYSSNRYWLGTYSCNGTTGTLTTCGYRDKKGRYNCNGGSGHYSDNYMCTASSSTKYKVYQTCSTNFTTTRSVKGGGMSTTESCKCQNVTVSFDINGGSGTTPSPITLNYGGVIGYGNMPRTSTFSHSTLIFDGWYTSPSGGTKLYYYTQITSNVTYYAHWRKVKLIYEYSGYDIDTKCVGTTIERNKGQTWGTLCTPTSSTDYVRKYWYSDWDSIDENGAPVNGTKVTKNSVAGDDDTYAYVIYTRKYTLTYNSDGGSSCTAKKVVSGKTWGTLCTPTKSGYKFIGWYASRNGKGALVTSSSVVYDDLTVYAYWVSTGSSITPSNPPTNNICDYEGDSYDYSYYDTTDCGYGACVTLNIGDPEVHHYGTFRGVYECNGSTRRGTLKYCKVEAYSESSASSNNYDSASSNVDSSECTSEGVPTTTSCSC